MCLPLYCVHPYLCYSILLHLRFMLDSEWVFLLFSVMPLFSPLLLFILILDKLHKI